LIVEVVSLKVKLIDMDIQAEKLHLITWLTQLNDSFVIRVSLKTPLALRFWRRERVEVKKTKVF